MDVGGSHEISYSHSEYYCCCNLDELWIFRVLFFLDCSVMQNKYIFPTGNKPSQNIQSLKSSLFILDKRDLKISQL